VVEVSFFFVGTFFKPPLPVGIVVLYLLQLCTQEGQLRKCWVEGRWNVGVEDRQAKEGQKAFFGTLCYILLIYKIVGGNGGY
jgi:hypothetical protein